MNGNGTSAYISSFQLFFLNTPSLLMMQWTQIFFFTYFQVAIVFLSIPSLLMMQCTQIFTYF